MPLVPERGFLPDLEAIPEETAQAAKLMFINYPNNPTAGVADLDFMRRAVDFARRYDILLCHDAAYIENTYDGFVAPSVLQVEGGKNVALEFYSLSKPFNMTGWRLAAAVGNAAAVAGLDPHMAENMPQAATLAMATPPGSLPHHLWAASNKSLLALEYAKQPPLKQTGELPVSRNCSGIRRYFARASRTVSGQPKKRGS
jgi:aspartate/methionine/tyrosine aminotransferase